MKVANRTTLTIAHQFADGVPFSMFLPVGFDADTFIVRQMSYGGCTNDTFMSVIQTDLSQFGDGIIGQVYANTNAATGPPVITNTSIAMTISTNAEFKVNRGKINSGQAKFSILAIGPAASQGAQDIYVQNTSADGLLIITLEFLKYH